MREKGCKLIAMLLLPCCVALTGCMNKEEERGIEKVLRTYNEEYTIAKLPLVASPYGVANMDGRILVTDWNSNAILVLDDTYHLQAGVGSLGSDHLEFIEPTGIAYNAENIYVVDSGNHRIQVLDRQYQYVREVKLPNIAGERFMDIVIDKYKNVYIWCTPGSIYHFTLESDETVTKIHDSFYGALQNGQQGALAITTLESNKKEDDDIYFQSGNNEIYSLEGNEMKPIASLPYKYAPADAVVLSSEMYLLSAAWHTLDKYSTQGKYVSSIINFSEYSLTIAPGYAHIARHTDNEFIVAIVDVENTEKSGLYIIERPEPD